MPLFLLQQMPLPESPEMTTASWIFIGAAWFFVITLVLWSFIKVIWGDRAT
ncbi:MAG: hypothetical protein ACI9EF_002640 [Pseudohongiellaceae bacterium]|jgi:hypothetical protein